MTQRTRFLNQLDYLSKKFKQWETVGDPTPAHGIGDDLDMYARSYHDQKVRLSQADVEKSWYKMNINSTYGKFGNPKSLIDSGNLARPRVDVSKFTAGFEPPQPVYFGGRRHGKRWTMAEVCDLIGITPLENSIRRLRRKGFQVAKVIEINGGKKTMMIKTIRAARKVNGRVEFYNKTFVLLLNSRGDTVYTSA